MIHKFAALLHLKDIDAFVKDITKAAAARQLEHGHPIDAMRLYNLAEVTFDFAEKKRDAQKKSCRNTIKYCVS